MTASSQYRLLTSEQARDELQIDSAKFNWLIQTNQLTPVNLCGIDMFDSNDIDGLVRAYKSVAERKRKQ